jgi:RNA polymerase sigma-54 factor
MAMHGGMAARQQQTSTMVPEHLLGKSVLKMSLEESERFVEAQFAENPALSIEQDAQCPACGGILHGNYCPSCGSSRGEPEFDSYIGDDDWRERVVTSSVAADDDYFEPFARVAAPKSMEDYLREQVRLSTDEIDVDIAYGIIDSLDEDGYLREPLVEIASRLRASVPQVEPVLQQVQLLDPPGIAARDLRECLLLQLNRLSISPMKDLAESIVREHWDLLSRMKLDKIASGLHASVESVRESLRFLSENTSPHPASMFRDEWETFSPRTASKVRPDVAVYRTDEGLVADISSPVSGRVSIESTYADLYDEMSQKNKAYSERDKVHVKECVSKAQVLIDALEFRKSTLRRIADELIRVQEKFFIEGPIALKPMTKKDLAELVGLHESTICRATQDKMIRMPSGEVVSFDMLFDSALPVKEMVKGLAAERLSDSEIARRLCESGVQIARRTVAKYRDQLGVLPVEFRIR